MDKVSVLFLGTHGQHNIGDELLLESFLRALGQDNTYIVNSYEPEFTDAQVGDRFDVTTFHTTENKVDVLKHIMSCDVLFFGGGSILKELYASIGRNRYATLVMVLAVVTFASKIARKPIVMSNIGVGPITSKPGEALATAIMRQVDIVAVRDRPSFELCRRLKLGRTTVRQVPDAVFRNPPAELLGDPVVAAPTPRDLSESDVIRVGLNLNMDIANPDNWDTFLKNLEDGLRQFHEARRIELHMIPMQSRGKEHHDAAVLRDFVARLPEIPHVAHETVDHEDVARALAGCDIVCSERLHVLVIAAILGVPNMALAYDVKVQGLAESLGTAEYVVDINRPFDTSEFAETLARLTANRFDVHDHLIARSSGFRAELDAHFNEVTGWIGDRTKPGADSGG